MLRHFAIVRSLATVTVALTLATVACATAHAQYAVPVSLPMARVAPTYMIVLHAGKSATFADADGYSCPARDSGKRSYPSDVSAYRWDGSALGAQHWNKDQTLQVWDVPRHRTYVSYDGATFFNHTHRSVLVALWCE